MIPRVVLVPRGASHPPADGFRRYCKLQSHHVVLSRQAIPQTCILPPWCVTYFIRFPVKATYNSYLAKKHG